MAGSTFICAKDASALDGIDWPEFETWEHFPNVDLDHMMTLDFAVMLQPKKVAFTNSQPIFFDAEGGMAVMKINAEALKVLRNWSEAVDAACQEDFQHFLQFLDAQGMEGIYEIATF